jgi:hypothetical protein
MFKIRKAVKLAILILLYYTSTAFTCIFLSGRNMNVNNYNSKLFSHLTDRNINVIKLNYTINQNEKNILDSINKNSTDDYLIVGHYTGCTDVTKFYLSN